jgi:hypothetical protein
MQKMRKPLCTVYYGIRQVEGGLPFMPERQYSTTIYRRFFSERKFRQ